MLKKAVPFAIAMLLMGGPFISVAAADRPQASEVRRGEFNPFSVRPSVRPTLRFFSFSWFGGRTAVNPSLVQPARPQRSSLASPPVSDPPLGSAIQAADEEEPTPPTSTIHGEEPPVRSPFRPAPRGPF